MPWNPPPLTHPSSKERESSGSRSRVVGAGEMADRVRDFNWASTPLGPIESWSAELVSAVNLTLASPVATRLLWGPNLHLIYNDNYRRIPGKRHPEALGRPAREVYTESWHVVGPLLERAYATGTSIAHKKLLVPIETSDGIHDYYLDYVYSPVFEEGRVAGLFGWLHDVTGEVTAVRSLRENEARSSRVLHSIGDAVIVTDPERCVMQMNRVAEELTGWTCGEANQQPLATVFRIIDENTRRPIQPLNDTSRRAGADALQGRTPILIRKDGAEIPIDDNASLIFDEDGNVTGTVLVFRDLRERRDVERERNDIADQLSLVLDATTDGVLSIDRNWNMVYCNRRAQEMLSASGELIGRQFWETFPESVYPGSIYVASYYKAMDQGEASRFEAWYPEPLNAWYAVDAQPAPHGIVIFFHDITAQKLEAEALRDREAKLKAVYSVSLEHISLLTPDGCIVDTNRTALDFVGIEREKVIGKHFADTPWFGLTPDASQTVREAVSQAQHGKTIYRQLTLNRADGESFIFDFSIAPVRDDAGIIVYLVYEGRDITEAKRAEAALLQSEKLAAVGRLASSIAHEINNPLESVMNLIYLARNGSPEDARNFLDIADQEIRRVSIIANQTLRFHKQASNPQAVKAADLFSTVMSIYEGRLRNARVQVERKFRTDEPVWCFQGDVRQVLNNLVSNALEAMPFGGRLLIRSRKGRDWKTGRPGLILTVADNGSGIPREVQRHIFEAFFTTKGTAGNGLGLWVCQEIVQRHHGALRVRSCTRQGRSGTTFTLFLPFDQQCQQ
jgi:PAS domain S-box-containing protein